VWRERMVAGNDNGVKSQCEVTLVKDLMTHLVHLLSSDPEYCFLGALPKHMERASRHTGEQAPQVSKAVEIEGMGVGNFRENFICDKQGAAALQQLLESSSPQLQQIAAVVRHDLPYLITHKFGNYVLQKLIPVDDQLKSAVIRLACIHFDVLVINEFSSRVMQHLVENDLGFRIEALHQFAEKKDLWLKSIAALFVLSSCMRHSTPKEYAFVVDFLLKSRPRLLASKFYKRATVSLVECLPEDRLHPVFEFISFAHSLHESLEDKYLTYVLIAFLRREHAPALELLCTAIEDDLASLLRCIYFKLLLNKLLSLGHTRLLHRLHFSLSLVSNGQLHELAAERRGEANILYSLYLVLGTGKGMNLDAMREVIGRYLKFCPATLISQDLRNLL